MPTYIDGIGASENIDSSGERIIIAGLDISSLDKDGIFNYEHKNDQPSQIVGKVLKAKKIFSDKDCEDERQAYYWQKVQVPFLYVMGELFDDYKDSAKDVAGMFRYDAAKKGQNERNVMNFSVEGAKIAKEGMDIVRSIARKITITVLPCNKMAIAEMVPAAGAKPKDDLDSIFKTESVIEIEFVKDPVATLEMMKKEPLKKELGVASGGSNALDGVAPMGPMAASEKCDHGRLVKSVKIGRTKSGKDVMSHGRVGEYGFSAEEHSEASAFHQKAAESTKNPRLGRHHSDKAKLHHGASVTSKDAAARRTATNKQIASAPGGKAKTLHDPKLSGKVDYKRTMAKGLADGAATNTDKPFPPDKKKEPKVRTSISVTTSVGGMAKALEAGSSNAAPSNLSQGAALGKESLFSKKPKHPTIKAPNVGRTNTGFGSIAHKPGASQSGFGKVIMKSQWLQRAREEYGKWEKREQFRTFMKSRLPHLAMGEIDAIGQTLALSKALKAEKTLSKIADAQNFQHSYVAKKEDKK